MGQYLQMGICYQMKIDNKRLDMLGITFEKLIIELNKYVDISLYAIKVSQDEIIFEIKESIVLEQLQGFMQNLFWMYPKVPYIDCFQSAVEKVGGLSSLREIEELANEKYLPCFQSNKIIDEIKISAWSWMEIEISMIVFFVEGKIFMEGYDSFLRFIEKNIRESSKKWTIAGAFKCYID